MGKKLAASVRVKDEDGRQVVLSAGDELPSWAESQVTNPAALEEAAEEEQYVTAEAASAAEGEGGVAFEEYADDDLTVDDGAPKVSDYESMTVTELRAEIKSRNTTRPEAEQLPADGVKADLVAALVADDQA